jgi:hypothetical protein
LPAKIDNLDILKSKPLKSEKDKIKKLESPAPKKKTKPLVTRDEYISPEV